jgi:hypothetical protein
MTSNWTLPTSVIQYAEPGAENYDVSWNDVNNFHSLKYRDGRYIKTSRDLLHIAIQPKHDFVEKTYFLKIIGFNFINLPNTLSGIEMRLTMNRYGRISDETIQLCLDDNLIGDNQTKLGLDPITIYGSNIDVWNSALTITDIKNPTFGVILRFRSHPNWPHKNSALIDAVELRVH